MKLRKTKARVCPLLVSIFTLMVFGHIPLAHATTNASNGASVAGVSRNSNNLEVFWVDDSGAINHAYWNGGDWGAAIVAYAGETYSTSNLTAVSRDSNHWDIFYPNNIGVLNHIYWDASSGQFGPSAVKGSINNLAVYGGVSAVSPSSNIMDVFYVGSDNSLKHAYWMDSSGWSDPETLANAGTVRPNSNVAAISRKPNTVEVFFVGADRSLKHVYWYSGQAWSQPNALTSSYAVHASTAPPGPGPGIAAVSRDPDKLEVFFLGDDNTIHHVYWSEWGSWSADSQLPGAAHVGLGNGGVIAAVSRASNAMEVFYNTWNGGGNLYHQYWDGSNWSGSGPVYGNAAYCTDRGVAAVARSQTQMEVWYTDLFGYVLQDLDYDPSYVWHTQTLPRYMAIPLVGQEQPFWCWAAAAQMIAAHSNVSVSQCQEATTYLGQGNCCPAGSNPACNVGYSYGQVLTGHGFTFTDKYYYDYQDPGVFTRNGTAYLTFEELQNQFAQDRPVAFVHKWANGGHEMVVTGTHYTAGWNQWVTVFDPAPDAYDTLYTAWINPPGVYHYRDSFNIAHH